MQQACIVSLSKRGIELSKGIRPLTPKQQDLAELDSAIQKHQQDLSVVLAKLAQFGASNNSVKVALRGQLTDLNAQLEMMLILRDDLQRLPDHSYL